MFSNPSESAGLEIEEGKYYGKVIRLEPTDGQFGPQVKWTWELATLDGQVLTNDRGFNAEWWQWSSPKISRGGKKPSKAYLWGSALLPGVEIMEMTGEAFAKAVVGKKAVLLIGPNDNGNTTILSMSPLPAKNGAGKTAPTAPATSPEEPPDDPAAIEAAVSESAEAVGAGEPW